MRNSTKFHVMGIALVFHAFVVPAQADELAAVATAMENWQYQRLFTPSPQARQAEQAGAIVIYDGLTDTTVARALDLHFDRIQNMMFTRTVITDADGEPLRDPRTGDVLQEDDGC